MDADIEKIELIIDIIGTRKNYHELLQHNSFTDSEKEILLNASVNAHNSNPNKLLIENAYNILVTKSLIESKQFDSPSKTNKQKDTKERKQKDTKERKQKDTKERKEEKERYKQYKQKEQEEEKKEYEQYVQKEQYKQYKQNEQRKKNNDIFDGLINLAQAIFAFWLLYILMSCEDTNSTSHPTTTTTTTTKKHKYKREFYEGTIRDNCQKKWGNDYRMVRYCIKKQTEAKEELGL